MPDPALTPTLISSDPLATLRSTQLSSLSSMDSDDSFDFDGAPPPRAESAKSGTAYRFEEIIGAGGFGEVREARQESLDRTVAVKSLRPDVVARASRRPADLWQAETSFRQEALTMAALEHPAIVPIHDLVWDSKGHLLIVMKRVHGTRWDEAVRREIDSMDREEYLARHLPILLDVAQAIAYAHSRGIVHRDIKPQQVMIGEFGEVMLMDWGLAMVYDRGIIDRVVSTVGAQMLPDHDSASNPAGTPAYMAPEQTDRTPERIGPWTDVYLLGATLYFLLTGRALRDGAEAREVYAKAMLGEIVPLEKAAGGRAVPEALANLVRRSVCAEPEERIRDAAEFVRLLQESVVGADRRNQSRSIVEDVERESLTPDAKYCQYAQAIERLGHALTLWPANRRAQELREATARKLVQCAIARRDVSLATYCVEALPPHEPETARLRERIASTQTSCMCRAAAPWVLAVAATIVAVVGFLT